MITTVIGIDPGVSGGWCVLTVDEGIVSKVRTIEMPESEVDIARTLRCSILVHTEYGSEPIIVIEKVGGFMGDTAGVEKKRNKAAAHTMFKFGENYGFVKGVLRSMGMPFHAIRPVEWQLHFHMRKEKKEKQYKWKHRLMGKALFLYPTQKFALKLADAVLIATYAYTKYGKYQTTHG